MEQKIKKTKNQKNKTFISKSEKETFELGKKIATTLSGGEVLCLVGDLGSGKTVFTKGLASGLGIKKTVTSPTFVLLKPYQIKKTKNQENKESNFKNIRTLAHIDAYRLQNGEQLKAIGVEDFFTDKNCVTVIEWADRVKDVWPKESHLLTFKVQDKYREINY